MQAMQAIAISEDPGYDSNDSLDQHPSRAMDWMAADARPYGYHSNFHLQPQAGSGVGLL